jgi:NAD(P)-dependent dehydrogenase (short-subunit alcohol dehydrogenase family)
MDLELKDEVAVVVGAAQGLGRAIASAFAAEGAIVALVDRSPEVSATAQAIASARQARTEPFVADVTDFEAMRAVEKQIRARFGRCDHVAHAAAIGSGKFGFPFWNLEPGEWDRVLHVNLTGAANVGHAFGPGMAEARSGTMLFIASVAGQIGSPTDPPYSASKAGVINFAQCAARDLAPFGVRVNTICPGMIRTALNRSVWAAWAARQPEDQRTPYEEWAEEKIRKLIPLGRWQEPEDVAAVAVFLASTRARNITGQTINVDGGWVMHS